MEKLDLDSLDIDPFGLSPASVADDFTFLHERDRSGLIAEAERRGERTQLLDKPRAKLERLLEFHAMRVSAGSELIHLPKPGEQWRLVTQQHFNTFTFILDLVKRRGRIDELDIVTFNVNEPTIDALCGLFDQGRVKVLRMVISDSIKFRMPKRVLQIRAAFEERKKPDGSRSCFAGIMPKSPWPPSETTATLSRGAATFPTTPKSSNIFTRTTGKLTTFIGHG